MSFNNLIADFLNKIGFSSLQWEQLKSNEGHFSVLMPGTASYKKHNAKTSFGTLDIHEYSLNKSDIAFSASYCDYPDREVKKISQQVMLNNVRNGVVDGMHGRLISELVIEINGYPGRHLHIEIFSGDGVMEGYIYLVGNRLYQISVATSKENAFSTDISKYLNSFKI